MPRTHRRKYRKTMGGGFLDTLSNWGSSLWQKTKQATSSATSSLSGSPTSTPAYSQSSSSAQAPAYVQSPSYTQPPAYVQSPAYTQSMTTSRYGGKRSRKHSRRMRGGFKDNTPTTGLAAHAASFSGVTAKPHTLVGGKTRKHRKHRRH